MKLPGRPLGCNGGSAIAADRLHWPIGHCNRIARCNDIFPTRSTNYMYEEESTKNMWGQEHVGNMHLKKSTWAKSHPRLTIAWVQPPSSIVPFVTTSLLHNGRLVLRHELQQALIIDDTRRVVDGQA